MAAELCCKVRYDYYDYDTTLGWLLKYQGEAEPGVGIAEAKWRIRKYIYDSEGLIIQIDWADGVNTFDKIWNSRDGYAYS